MAWSTSQLNTRILRPGTLSPRDGYREMKGRVGSRFTEDWLLWFHDGDGDFFCSPLVLGIPTGGGNGEGRTTERHRKS